jgi:hypothetical protein
VPARRTPRAVRVHQHENIMRWAVRSYGNLDRKSSKCVQTGDDADDILVKFSFQVTRYPFGILRLQFSVRGPSSAWSLSSSSYTSSPFTAR